jgi:hypothetical protein
MTVKKKTYTTGVACDKPGCTAQIGGEERSNFEGQDYYLDLAESQGWTFWVGRNQRHYCPDHGPSKGHTMRPLVRYRRGGAR